MLSENIRWGLVFTKKSAIGLVFLATSAVAAYGEGGAERSAPAEAEVRLKSIEERLALIERKLALLAVNDERELTNPGTVFDNAGLLLKQAQYAIAEERNLQKAYRYLSAIHALHPKSPESREAFSLAAGIFKRQYFASRYTAPDSVWLQAEPAFLFHWLSGYFAEESAPENELKALLLGMPLSFFKEFERHQQRIASLRTWNVSVTDDNGFIDTISFITTTAK